MTTLNDGQLRDKGTLVVVCGLESEAGKKLNGSHGITLGKATTDKEGIVRYPVFMFSIPKEETGTIKPIIEDAPRKKIKAENLALVAENSPEVLELFKKSILSHKDAAMAKEDLEAVKCVHFLVEQCYQRFPDDLTLVTPYAFSLIFCHQESMRAADLLLPFVPKLLAEDIAADPKILEQVSAILASMGPNCFQQALDVALKSPTDSKKNKDIAVGALRALAAVCSQADGNTPILALRAAQEAHKIDPSQAPRAFDVGEALAEGGNHLEAAKQFRKIMAMEETQQDEAKLTRVKEALVLAQMQCPGMELEEYTILGCKDFWAWGTAPLDEEGERPMKHFNLPRDPDDPNVFPDWLLEQVKAE